jgi:hypothetical protein
MPIYLEFAPEQVVAQENLKKVEQEDSEEENNDDGDIDKRMKTVFVKNLNFATTEA